MFATRLDEAFNRVNAMAPGFGGMFIDNNGFLVLQLRDTSARQLSIAAVAGVFGKFASVKGRSIRTQRVSYDVGQLAAFLETVADRIVASRIPFSYLDLDERANKVAIGVPSPAESSAVVQLLSSQVPADARDVIVSGVRPLATLNDQVRPASSGLCIVNETAGGFNGCSIGFSATKYPNAYAGLYYVATAAHCTSDLGSADGEYMYQPLEAQGTALAVEADNPPGFACTRVGVLKPCRYSDAALFQLVVDTSQFGLYTIERTDPDSVSDDLSRPGGLTIYGSWFRVVAEVSDPFLVGQTVSKIGATTGWTRGQISRTGVLATGPDGYWLLDQTDAALYVDAGDSGGPVFVELGGDSVSIAGIATKGQAGVSFEFSSLANVQQDFGTLRTYPGKPQFP